MHGGVQLTLGPGLQALDVLLLLPPLLTTRLSYTRSASWDAPTASSHGLCLQQQQQQRRRQKDKLISNTRPCKINSIDSS
jgi:hypothetical protein